MNSLKDKMIEKKLKRLGEESRNADTAKAMELGIQIKELRSQMSPEGLKKMEEKTKERMKSKKEKPELKLEILPPQDISDVLGSNYSLASIPSQLKRSNAMIRPVHSVTGLAQTIGAQSPKIEVPIDRSKLFDSSVIFLESKPNQNVFDSNATLIGEKSSDTIVGNVSNTYANLPTMSKF